jgi:protein TonB
MPASSTRLGQFVAISLALHAAVLLGVRNDTPARNWMAGPVIVRLLAVSGSTPESSPTRHTTADTIQKQTPSRTAMQSTATTEKISSRSRPARVPDRTPAMIEQPADTDPSPAPAQQGSAQAATRKKALEQQLINSLHAALMPHFSYPLLARRRGWEGTVRVGVRVEANGSLTRLHLVEPSPYAVLNTAAINSLSRLARLPNADNWLQGGHVDLILPVEYRLLEG